MNNDFKFIMPAGLSKSDDGDWIVSGLASTNSVDQQGEIIDQKGMDLSPIDQKRGYFNFDHLPGVENLLGTIDGYNKTDRGLFVKGRLFKNHEKAKAIHQVMSSLNKAEDQGRIGMSVEGKILERDPKNPKIIKKCRIDKVALTLNPVNKDTYAELAKSLNHESLVKSICASDIEFNATQENYVIEDASQESPTFTASQVVEIIQKALSISGSAATQAPNTMSGGDALAPESLEKECDKPKKKKLKKASAEHFQKSLIDALDKLQVLYPQYSRSILWDALQTRISDCSDIDKD